jgi:hypothetical protein
VQQSGQPISTKPQVPLVHEQGKVQALRGVILAWHWPKLHQEFTGSHSPAQPLGLTVQPV